MDPPQSLTLSIFIFILTKKLVYIVKLLFFLLNCCEIIMVFDEDVTL
jgi:hypothetical protein